MRQQTSFASVLDFRSGIVEVCVPLGYGAPRLVKWIILTIFKGVIPLCIAII